jgi:hypothetical protein
VTAKVKGVGVEMAVGTAIEMATEMAIEIGG